MENRNTNTKKILFAMSNLHRNMTNRLILEQVPLFPVPAGRLAQSVDCVKKKVANQKIKCYHHHLHSDLTTAPTAGSPAGGGGGFRPGPCRIRLGRPHIWGNCRGRDGTRRILVPSFLGLPAGSMVHLLYLVKEQVEFPPAFRRGRNGFDSPGDFLVQ